jgi:hypothetical protein
MNFSLVFPPILLGFSLSAHAVLGPTLNIDQNPGFFTGISQGSFKRSDCSGTFIDAETIVTAAHCVDGIEIKDLTSLYTYNSFTDGFSNSVQIKSVSTYDSPIIYPQSDIVEVKIQQPVSEILFPDLINKEDLERFFVDIKPESIHEIEVAQVTGDPLKIKFQKKLAPHIECRFTGVGKAVDAKGNQTLFTPRTIKINELEILRESSTANWILINAEKNGKLQNTPVQGDSGGPFYCREEIKSNWKLLGVLSIGNSRQYQIRLLDTD